MELGVGVAVGSSLHLSHLVQMLLIFYTPPTRTSTQNSHMLIIYFIITILNIGIRINTLKNLDRYREFAKKLARCF